jgi:hypothetical protein
MKVITMLPADFLDGLLHAADEDEAAGHHLQADYIRKAHAEIERLRKLAFALEFRLSNLQDEIMAITASAGQSGGQSDG